MIQSSINTKGAIIIDDGARKALLKGKKFAAVGIVSFRGSFFKEAILFKYCLKILKLQ